MVISFRSICRILTGVMVSFGIMQYFSSESITIDRTELSFATKLNLVMLAPDGTSIIKEDLIHPEK
jgi:hypothetical protein